LTAKIVKSLDKRGYFNDFYVKKFFSKKKVLTLQKNIMQKLYSFILLFILFGCSKNVETRFIAHAGGEVEGYSYTNSLEAMNLSYSKGCKLYYRNLRRKTCCSARLETFQKNHKLSGRNQRFTFDRKGVFGFENFWQIYANEYANDKRLVFRA